MPVNPLRMCANLTADLRIQLRMCANLCKSVRECSRISCESAGPERECARMCANVRECARIRECARMRRECARKCANVCECGCVPPRMCRECVRMLPRMFANVRVFVANVCESMPYLRMELVTSAVWYVRVSVVLRCAPFAQEVMRWSCGPTCYVGARVATKLRSCALR